MSYWLYLLENIIGLGFVSVYLNCDVYVTKYGQCTYIITLHTYIKHLPGMI